MVAVGTFRYVTAALSRVHLLISHNLSMLSNNIRPSGRTVPRPVLLPDGEQFVEQIGSGSQQRSSGQIERLPPPGIRTQSRHDSAAVAAHGKCDDGPIKRRLPAGRDALAPAEVNRARPRPGQTHLPAAAHARGRPRPLSASLSASWVLRSTAVGRRTRRRAPRLRLVPAAGSFTSSATQPSSSSSPVLLL